MTITPVSMLPGSQYAFGLWSDASTVSPRTFNGTAIGSTQSFVATLKQQYQVFTMALPSNGGAFTGAGWHDNGSTATVPSAAATGYRFAAFTNPASRSNTVSVPVSRQPVTVTADFSAIANGLGDVVTVPIAPRR